MYRIKNKIKKYRKFINKSKAKYSARLVANYLVVLFRLLKTIGNSETSNDAIKKQREQNHAKKTVDVDINKSIKTFKRQRREETEESRKNRNYRTKIEKVSGLSSIEFEDSIGFESNLKREYINRYENMNPCTSTPAMDLIRKKRNRATAEHESKVTRKSPTPSKKSPAKVKQMDTEMKRHEDDSNNPFQSRETNYAVNEKLIKLCEKIVDEGSAQKEENILNTSTCTQKTKSKIEIIKFDSAQFLEQKFDHTRLTYTEFKKIKDRINEKNLNEKEKIKDLNLYEKEKNIEFKLNEKEKNTELNLNEKEKNKELNLNEKEKNKALNLYEKEKKELKLNEKDKNIELIKESEEMREAKKIGNENENKIEVDIRYETEIEGGEEEDLYEISDELKFNINNFFMARRNEEQNGVTEQKSIKAEDLSTDDEQDSKK
jgi:hypothetical protein